MDGWSELEPGAKWNFSPGPSQFNRERYRERQSSHADFAFHEGLLIKVTDTQG